MCICADKPLPRNLESDLPPLRRPTDEAWKPGGLPRPEPATHLWPGSHGSAMTEGADREFRMTPRALALIHPARRRGYVNCKCEGGHPPGLRPRLEKVVAARAAQNLARSARGHTGFIGVHAPITLY